MRCGDREIVPGDVGWHRRRGYLPDEGDGLGAAAGGEQAVMADAVEAVGQDVEQEAADERVAVSVKVLRQALPAERAR